MIYIIIPCYNESLFLKEIIEEADKSLADRILIVDNGSTDDTLELIRESSSGKIDILYCNTPLGYDVPRAVGLHQGLLEGGEYFVFLDGDMNGITALDINNIIRSLKLGVDLSLTDCYYNGELPTGLGHFVIEFRSMLNKELKLYDKIRHSTPSHGPHGISRRLALSVPLHYIAVPPLLLCWGAKMGYTIEIGLNKLHKFMGSAPRGENHALKMTETIIGDCVCGINYIRKNMMSRIYDGIEYSGYHSERRFDLLDIIIRDAAPGV